MAWLQEANGIGRGITRGHATWSDAMRAAIALAQRRGLEVANKEVTLRACDERDALRSTRAKAVR